MADEPRGAVPSAHQPLPPALRREQSPDLTAQMPAVRGRPSRLPPDQLPHEPLAKAAEQAAEPTAGPPTAPAPVVAGPRGSRVSIGEGPPPDHWYEEQTRERGFRARFAVVYDVNGPRVSLGVGWALLVAGALAYGPGRLAALAVLFGATAGWAASQIVTAWRPEGRPLDRWVATAGAAALPLATGAFGARGTGGALVGFAAVALVTGWIAGRTWRATTEIAGRAVTCGVWVGLAGATVVLTLRYEIGAVITLLVLVGVYEASDYIVGSGASNRVEGPLAGIISIAVVTAIVAFLHVPPFEGLDAFAFGGVAAVLCPIGQFVGSGLLPFPAAHAPALRRLDSLLVLAPVWAWLIGLLLVHQT